MARAKRELTELLSMAAEDPSELSRGELEQLAAAAGRTREEFLSEIFKALNGKKLEGYDLDAFKRCVFLIGKIMTQGGILSSEEMQKVWVGVEML